MTEQTPPEGKPCEKCPWTSKDPRDVELTAKPAFKNAMESGQWFACHVHMGTCHGARLRHAAHVRQTGATS